MKVLIWFFTIIVFVGLILYGVLFSEIGNNFVKPLLEKEIVKNTKLPTKLQKFKIRDDNFEIVMELNKHNIIYINGNYSFLSQSFNLNYKLEFKELITLESITKTKLNGSFFSVGDIKGDLDFMEIDGVSNVAKGDTKYNIELTQFKPTSIIAKMQKVDLKSLLYILNQKNYANAKIDLDINFKNITPNQLDGDIKMKLLKGKLNSKIINDDFNMELPQVYFNISTYTLCKGDKLNTKLMLNSNLAKLSIKDANFDLKSNFLESDYKVTIDNLAKFYFIIQRDLEGGFIANGILKKDKNFDLSMYSNLANGSLKLKLHNDDLVVNISDFQTLKISEILLYPKIFKSKLDGELNYNLKNKKGRFKGKLSKGVFIENQVFDLAKKYTHLNLYKEKFSGYINSKIDREIISTTFKLNSNKSSITTENTRLNTLSNNIYSNIKIDANSNFLVVKLSGDINSPKVKIDAKELIKKEVKKVINKELKRHLNENSLNKLLNHFF